LLVLLNTIFEKKTRGENSAFLVDGFSTEEN
jgi:hypothetical protein